MNYTVGYRNILGKIGIARIGDVDTFEEARQAVIDGLGVKTVLVLIETKNEK